MTLKKILHATRTLLCALILSCLSVISIATAQDTPNRKFSKKIGKSTFEALNHINKQNYKPAADILNDLLERDLSPYERATILQMKGQTYYELDQVKIAVEAFENAIASGGLLPSEVNRLRLNIAQLHIGEGDYVTGAENIEQWARDGNELKPKHIEMLVQTWILADNYQRALPWAEKWFEMANPKQRKHYNLVYFLYSNLQLPHKQIEIIKAMTKRWPADVTLRKDLVSVYENKGDEKAAFDVAKDMYDSGLTRSEHDILSLVQRYGYFKLYGEGAALLDKEVQAKRVRETPRNLVYLSHLYEKSGQTNYANGFFQQAVTLSNFEAANMIKAEVSNPLTKTPLVKPLAPAMIPFYQAPKINQSNFKIQVSDRDAQPLVRIPPTMPLRATKSGRCKLRFNVTREGAPIDITATYCTEKIFERTAVRSVEKWKYNPKIVDQKAVARTGVETTVKFRLTDSEGRVIPE